MAYLFRLPDVGEGMAEGEIVAFLVAEGDEVKEGDSVAEIQNDKSVEEIASPVAGKVTKLLVEAGTVVEVGEAIIEIDAPGYEDQAGADEAAQPNTPEDDATQPAENLPTEGVAPAANSGQSYFSFKMPDVGEGMAEGEIVAWLVEEGAEVNEGDSVAEVQNDKSVEEIASPVTGKILKITVPAGTVVNVGEELLQIDSPGNNNTEGVAPTSAPAAQATTAEVAPTETTGEVPAIVDPNRLIKAMPSVRQFAREQGIDISQVPGTGKANRITKADVENFKAGGSQVQAAAPVAEGSQAAVTAAPTVQAEVSKPIAGYQGRADIDEPQTRVAMSGMRKAIAKAMVNSKHTAPHVTLHDEVEVTDLWNHRKKFKDVAAEQDTKLTFLPYAVKALVATVKKYPILNASIDDTTNEIVYKNYYNIGIATDTDAGLYVPNIKNADAKSMFAIADDITELAGKAHEGKLKSNEMADGTITISNIGSAGGGFFTPVINFPEAAILGFGAIKQEPVVNADGEIVVGRVLKLSLSFDHRIVDGATAQLALNEFKRLISNPELLLMQA